MVGALRHFRPPAKSKLQHLEDENRRLRFRVEELERQVSLVGFQADNERAEHEHQRMSQSW